MFSSVLVVNTGYTILSLSQSLDMALHANRIAYLGSAFLPYFMLMIILDVTNTTYKKWMCGTLFALSACMFLVTASPGILDIYYKEVSFEIINGVPTLVKVYGPLHVLYLFYLLGYFAAMVTVIVRSRIRKTIDSTTHAVILAIAVLVNIGVWFIEQVVNIDFEMLSVSYIISELFLFGARLLANENQRLREMVKVVESAKSYEESSSDDPSAMLKTPIDTEAFPPERIEMFVAGVKKLTPTEKEVYEAYVARVTTKEIMASLNIKESTLKYHSRNIYGKLGVASRKELLEIHKHVVSVKNSVET